MEVPEVPVKRTYKVIAAQGYAGHAEGEEFEAELDPFLEKWAKDQGLIEPVKKGKEKEGG